jgi:aryl sulfotransferase
MGTTAIPWPQRQRELHNHHFDSTVWNDFAFCADDIATYGKSGTTWVQQIAAQLLFNGAEDVSVAELSPWLDLLVPPKEVKLPAIEAQTHRRFLKTHLPIDALVFSRKAKYLYIGRDGRDVIFSMYNHHAKANERWHQALTTALAASVRPSRNRRRTFANIFANSSIANGYPFWPFFENVRSWWERCGTCPTCSCCISRG